MPKHHEPAREPPAGVAPRRLERFSLQPPRPALPLPLKLGPSPPVLRRSGVASAGRGLGTTKASPTGATRYLGCGSSPRTARICEVRPEVGEAMNSAAVDNVRVAVECEFGIAAR